MFHILFPCRLKLTVKPYIQLYSTTTFWSIPIMTVNRAHQRRKPLSHPTLNQRLCPLLMFHILYPCRLKLTVKTYIQLYSTTTFWSIPIMTVNRAHQRRRPLSHHTLNQGLCPLLMFHILYPCRLKLTVKPYIQLYSTTTFWSIPIMTVNRAHQRRRPLSHHTLNQGLCPLLMFHILYPCRLKLTVKTYIQLFSTTTFWSIPIMTVNRAHQRRRPLSHHTLNQGLCPLLMFHILYPCRLKLTVKTYIQLYSTTTFWSIPIMTVNRAHQRRRPLSHHTLNQGLCPLLMFHILYPCRLKLTVKPYIQLYSTTTFWSIPIMTVNKAHQRRRPLSHHTLNQGLCPLLMFHILYPYRLKLTVKTYIQLYSTTTFSLIPIMTVNRTHQRRRPLSHHTLNQRLCPLLMFHILYPCRLKLTVKTYIQLFSTTTFSLITITTVNRTHQRRRPQSHHTLNHSRLPSSRIS